MNSRFLVATLMFASGCLNSEPTPEVDSGVAFWAWPDDAVSVFVERTPGYQIQCCAASWRVTLGNGNLDFNLPMSGPTDLRQPEVRRTGSRALDPTELDRFVRAMRSIKFSSKSCGGTDGPTLRLSVQTPSSDELLGDESYCGSGRAIVDLSGVVTVLENLSD